MRKHSKTVLFLAATAILVVTVVLARGWLSRWLFDQGLQAKSEWHLARAIQRFEWSLTLNPDFRQARFEKGICHQLCGDFRASQPEFDRLLAESTVDRSFQAQLFNATGVNRFNSSEPDAAIEAHTRSLNLAKELADQRLEAQAMIDLSRVLYHSKGKPEAALANLQLALNIARQTSDARIEADALRNIGVVHWWYNGELDLTISQYYQPALERYQRLGDLRSIAITMSNIGLIEFDKGDFFQFMQRQNESIAIKQRIGDLAGLSDSYGALGNVYNQMENYRKALEHYSKSLELSRKTGYRLSQNDVESLIAIIYISVGEFDKAIALLKELTEQDRDNPSLVKYRIAQLAKCYLLKGETELAKPHFEWALEQSAFDRRFQISILNYLGMTATEMGDWQKASAYLAQAEALHSTHRERWWNGDVDNRLAWAELREKQGQSAAATRYLLEAADIESRIFASTDTPFIQGQNHKIYDRLFALLLKRTQAPQAISSQPNDEMVFDILERLRYRAFTNFVVQLGNKRVEQRPLPVKETEALSRIERLSEKLKNLESPLIREQLRSAYNDYEDLVLQAELSRPRYRLVEEARPAKLEEAQKALDGQTALIEYLFAEDQVFALVITRAKIQSVPLPVTRSNLVAKVKLLRALIFNDAQSDRPQPGSTDFLPVASDLHSVLIEPLEQVLPQTGVQRLGIIPYGFLHDLPFAAMVRRTGDELKYLIEDYAIFYAPSVTQLTLKYSPRPELSEMITFGRNASDEPELQRLSFAAEEARSVAEIFNGEARLELEASEVNLKRVAHHFRYIHFAMHAVSEPQMPLLSRLKLQSTAEEDGNLSAREIFDLGLQAEMVTLGACQSGQSFSVSGRSEVDRIGLIEAFLHAGAKSVLASLLPISDRPTTEFMKAFYQNMRTTDKAEALAQTQRAMLMGKLAHFENSGEHQYTHPRHWAAFILVGDYH